MDQQLDWRSPYFSGIFELYDRADFAQEFLRRNPAYRSEYVAARSARYADRHTALGRLARRWGMVFRRRSGS